MNPWPILESAIEALRSPDIYTVIPQTFYLNKQGVKGLYACFEKSGDYLTLSIHNCWQLLKPEDEAASMLANLIEGIKTVDQSKAGLYYNRHLIRGCYLTARSSVPVHGTCDHWFMIGVPNVNDEGFSLFEQHLLRAPIHRRVNSAIAEFFESSLWRKG